MNTIGFTIKEQDHICILTLDNPPANTWTIDSLMAFKSTIIALNENRKINALVIHSNQKKFFSAGAQLDTFHQADLSDVKAMAEAFGEAFEALSVFPGLTIAAISGYALGGGLEVALACDLRVVNPKSTLGLPEGKVGLLPCAGGTQNLTALVGEGWAKRMILCGEMVNGKQAVQLGLAEELADDPFAAAMALTANTKSISPDSLKACKQLIQGGRQHFRWEQLSRERELFMALFETDNQKEGVLAFLEKRSPTWNY
ncbi:MAG: enoyl-CoA hydratase [Endozoicomonadaceae bacterium]|nr:enoyl-CoA hydratase [Endozoicomonadaceae bacterium]